MKTTLNLILPKSWQELSDKQLRYVFRLLAGDYSLQQIKTRCLMRWAGLVPLRREGSVFIVEFHGETYPITALQVTEASAALNWLDGVPGYPVRLSRIGVHRPVRADFQEVSFGDFLALDNLYQGYLQTQRKDLLVEMAKVMYRCKRIRLKREEEICIFYWFASVKQMFSKMFSHFFQPLTTDGSTPLSPSLQQLQESMDTQIRALTGGDITKEKAVLEMDCWRAMSELNAKAKDYEDLKKAYKS